MGDQVAGGQVRWDAAAVEAALVEATRIVKLWSAGQRAPNHHQRRLMGLSPEQRARRARLLVPSAADLAQAEATLACLALIEDVHLRRLIRARAHGTPWRRLQELDGRCRSGLAKALRRAYTELAAKLNGQARQIVPGPGRSVHAA